MKTSPSFRLNAAAVAVALCFVSPIVWSNPTGGVVVSGSATMVNNGNTLTVTNTPGTVLNWQQFNIGQGQTTQFIQQSAQSTVLNRVVSNNPSQILGTLRSNGQVFLINPFGIMFGVGSVVDVNGLIASTLNISNADFLLGRMNFAGSNGTSVVNQGSITTPLGGRVYLIGNNVTNQGVITSPQGKVLLAAGNQVSLVDSTTPHISVTLSAPAGGQAVNLGTISAQGGSIDVYAPLIQQQGVLRADSAAIDPQGNIVLFATQNANLAQGSVTSANGAQGGSITVQSAGTATLAGQVSALGNAGVGGTVNVLGNQVDLTNSAQIDASGTLGGGTALVGGDFQGKNAAVQNAFTTTVAQGATINVSALGKGNGGKSVVWANDTTTFNGNIFARGGVQGGNGGNVEVSGKRALAFNGSVNTLAPLGRAGSLLLDPYSMCVFSTASPSCTGSTMTATALVANVLTNGTYTLTTSGGDLAVMEPIAIGGAAGAGIGKSLILEATGGSVWTLPAATMPGGVITTNGANLTLRAVKSTAGTGGEVHVSNTVSTFGGAFTINAQGLAVVENGGVTTEGGAVNINASSFTLGNTVATATQINTQAPATTPIGGNVSIKTSGTNAADGVTINAGSSISAGNGLIDLAGMSYSNLNTANLGTANYSIKSIGQGIFSFNNITNNFVDASVNAILIRTYTPPNATTPYNVLFGTVGPCPNALCFSPNTTDHIKTVAGGAVAASGNLTVTSNLQFNGGGQFALIAAGDIILNGSVSVLYPTGTTAPPTGSTSVALVAGNNVINNVGAAALSVPAGYTWSLFAKDQTTSVLNGLVSNVVNLGQGGSATSYTNALINGAIAKVTAGNFAFMQLIGNLLSAAGASTTTGNQAIFWGPASSNLSQFIAANHCVLNPLLCGATTDRAVQSNSQPTTPAGASAEADLNYSPALNVADGRVWVSYEDVRRSRREARQAEDDLDEDHARTGRTGRTSEFDLKVAWVSVKRAEARVRETEMELRASEAELKAAKSPEEQARAQVRHSVASFRHADAEVQQAQADVRHAAAAIKNAASPDAKAAAEQKQTEAQNRLAQAEVHRAEADVEKAQQESQRTDAVPTKHAEVEVKQAHLESKRAAAEVRTAKDPAARAVAEEKLTLALAKQAEAEARKANTEAQRAEDDAQSSGSPIAQRLAADKRLDAEVKQARADLRASEAAAKSAKDPVARANAEEKMAQAGLKKAESEGKQAAQEAKQAREDLKTVRSEVSKAVLLKKAEAEEARGTAKSLEVDARKAEIEVKKAEAAVKQADADVRAAKSPEQRAAAEKQLAEKQAALEGKREQVERKHNALEKARDVAEEKGHAYHTARSRRDERMIEAFGGVDLTTEGRRHSQELLAMRHDFMKEKLGAALKILAANPKAAEVKKCESGQSMGCIPTTILPLTPAAGEVVARVQLPLHIPSQAFLPEIQRKVAVVIGNNAYQDPDIPALNGAVRDADAVALMLKEKLGYDVRVVHNGTRADIVRTLNEIADETGSKDSVVVYYAGHGYQMEDNKEGYWIPSDASTSSPENWISNTDINQLLTNIPAKQMLVVSDSCFSGSLTNEQKVSSKVTSTETPAQILSKRSVVIMSSGGEEPVMDEGRDGHSIFAWHLLDKVQKLDTFEHGAEVFDAIRAGVAADGVPQLPEYGASVSAGHKNGGEYLFEVRKY